MRHTSLHTLYTALGAALLAICALHATPALAQRVFVAAQGSDANPCTFTLPCRTFQHAHDVVAAGGEIDVLDPAGYGALTINKSISIQGHGFAGISVASNGTGIAVNGGASDLIRLSGLLIDGVGVGFNGILVNSGKSLVIENCVVRHMALSGLLYLSTAATLQTLSVFNSFFTDNANRGIAIQAGSSGPIAAALERVAVTGNAGGGLSSNGSSGSGTVTVTVNDSVVSNNRNSNNTVAISASSLPGQSVVNVTVTRTMISGNGIGIDAAGSPAVVRIAQSTIVGNNFGLDANTGGTILSYGDNYIDANTNPSSPSGSATKH
jgi:hypothetical protein